MKKIIAAVAALAIGISCAVPAFASAQSIISISGDKGKTPISFRYTSDSDVIVKSVKSLFTKLNTVSKGRITQEITISSLTAANSPVAFTLRLSNPQPQVSSESPARIIPSPNPDSGNALDYYEIVIENDRGETIYDYKRDEKTPAKAEYKDIELKTLNTERSVDNETYKITVSANSALKELAADAARIDWLIISDTKPGEASADVLPSASPASSTSASSDATPSAAPGAQVIPPLSSEEPGVNPYAAPTAAPIITEAPAPSAAADVITPKPVQSQRMMLTKGTYTIGDEIAAGRYTVTGDSNVKVYTNGGDLKTNIILTTDERSQDGVKSYVLTLRDGELLELSGDTRFETYTPSKNTTAPTQKPSPTVTPRPTSTPRASSAPAKSTSAPSAKASSSSSKSNPKTGDNAPIALAVIIGTAACAMFAVLEIYKRKKKD